MINARELRIGNWVQMDNKHTVIGIKFKYGSDDYDISILRNKSLLIYEAPEKGLDPIPLTAEILEKCGFKFAFQRWSHNKTTFLIEFAGSHCQLIQQQYIGKPFQYLHQLQNLYYALTQKELEIKL